ncbi:putative bis(5'-nucleosyl)-tetraphosphatase [Aspergillus tanneri]|uniref:Bifunctional AP-4-A phosphorylase/ADP sulfurylase n=1 Tax=Aspergillus tanneri TaxID=1220188 RepID=A0A5M9M5J2_9EURO|nr:bifunctional AP-4-A phosphorylase/ADP sulfurylase [Aspergillus tanneri]KAA8642295.1 bifunctional AP-4-A phosphorylase/ADP sulfurylase [Aspergillus tanneri]
MQLGLSENLSALVARRFTSAKDGGHLLFSQTHLSTVSSSGIPFQIRYCPALANKPSGAPNSDQGRTGPKPDPFEDPSPELLIAQIPRENPSHTLVLNKFPVIPNHFILATKAWKLQTDILEKEDLEAAYSCVKAWAKETQTNGTEPKRLFAFFNSGNESGASQPHRHLQFLPVEAMSQGDTGNWQPLIDSILSQRISPGSEYRCLSFLPFAHFALPLPPNPSADTLHAIYLSLYRAALATAKDNLGDDIQTNTSGPAAISYNLAMTDSAMMICPRRNESSRIPVDPAASQDVADAGLVALNGTVLAGTLMVKAEAEWDQLRRNPRALTDVLAGIGYPQPDLRELSLL